MKHTEGEWIIKGHNIECVRDGINVILAHCGLMPVKYSDRKGFTKAVHKKRDKEIKANVKLIAGAPALFKACEAAEHELKNRYLAHRGSPIDKLVLKIITKAIDGAKE